MWWPLCLSELKSVDSFTVSLHSPNARQMPAVRTVQGDYQWALKDGGNSHWSRQTIHCDWDTSNLYLDQPISQDSYPTSGLMPPRTVQQCRKSVIHEVPVKWQVRIISIPTARCLCLSPSARLPLAGLGSPQGRSTAANSYTVRLTMPHRAPQIKSSGPKFVQETESVFWDNMRCLALNI